MLDMMKDNADRIIDRITAVYDSYMMAVAEMTEDSPFDDGDLVREAVLIDKHFSAINLMYVLMSDDEFAEALQCVLHMDEADILGCLLNLDNLIERSGNYGNSKAQGSYCAGAIS